MLSQDNRIIINVGAASLVAELISSTNTLALFMEDTTGRNTARRKLGVFADVALDVVEMAKSVVFHSAREADAWLWSAVTARQPSLSPLLT